MLRVMRVKTTLPYIYLEARERGKGISCPKKGHVFSMDARSVGFSVSYLLLSQPLVNELAEYARGSGV